MSIFFLSCALAKFIFVQIPYSTLLLHRLLLHTAFYSTAFITGICTIIIIMPSRPTDRHRQSTIVNRHRDAPSTEADHHHYYHLALPLRLRRLEPKPTIVTVILSLLQVTVTVTLIVLQVTVTLIVIVLQVTVTVTLI